MICGEKSLRNNYKQTFMDLISVHPRECFFFLLKWTIDYNYFGFHDIDLIEK